MTGRLADVVAQVQSVEQLDAVVTAMRGIAASRAQKSRSLLPGIEAYGDVVSHAIGRALKLQPQAAGAPVPRGRGGRGLILFCAELGFVGAFSERLLDAAADELQKATLFLVGSRGAAIAAERGIVPAWSSAMCTRTEAIPSLANLLIETLNGYLAVGTVTRIDVLFARAEPGGGIHVARDALLPLDFARFTDRDEITPPLTTLPAQLLLERLAAEYLFARLCSSAMHAFEAENEARMLAMAAAKDNIGAKLAGLSRRVRQLRQEAITTEIVELATGTEALRAR